jgi:hypothetical protein
MISIPRETEATIKAVAISQDKCTGATLRSILKMKLSAGLSFAKCKK